MVAEIQRGFGGGWTLLDIKESRLTIYNKLDVKYLILLIECNVIKPSELVNVHSIYLACHKPLSLSLSFSFSLPLSPFYPLSLILFIHYWIFQLRCAYDVMIIINVIIKHESCEYMREQWFIVVYHHFIIKNHKK